MMNLKFFNWKDEGEREVIHEIDTEVVTLCHNGKEAMTLGSDDGTEVYVLIPPPSGTPSFGELVARSYLTDAILIMNDMNWGIDWEVGRQEFHIYSSWEDIEDDKPSQIFKCDGVVVDDLFYAQPHSFLRGIVFVALEQGVSVGVSAYNGDLALEFLTPRGYYGEEIS